MLLEWNEEFNVGVESLNKQHKKLFETIRLLNDSVKLGKSEAAVKEALGRLVDYTATHFSAEEAQMLRSGYPDFNSHNREHNDFLFQVRDYMADLESGKKVVTIEILGFLCNWITEHIKGTDKKYGPFFNRKGIY